MRHLATSLRFGSRAAPAAVAATLLIGGVAVAQTGSATPEDETDAGGDVDGADDGGADGADEDGGGADGADEDDADEDDDATEGDAGAAEGEAGGDADEADEEPATDAADGADAAPATAGSKVGAADPGAARVDRGDRGERGGGRHDRRGSATSERVHEALTLDGELRPGDEGWGAAVSESARSGGHGERVSRAARGLDAPADAKPGNSGQAPGQGGSKGRSGR